MATPRRDWFKTPVDILTEQMDDLPLLRSVLLSALIARRWSHGAKAEELGDWIHLRPDEVIAVSRCDSVSEGVEALKQLKKDLTSLEVRSNGRTIEVKWPKCLEYQEWSSRLPGTTPGELPGTSPPRTRTPKQSRAEQSKKEEKTPTATPSKIACPEVLPDKSRDRIRAWAAKQSPPLVNGQLSYAWARVRDWADKKDARRTVKGWEATLRDGIRAKWALEGYGEKPQRGGAEHHGANRVFKGRDPETGEVRYE